MKYELPENHGLSAPIIAHLVFKDGDKPLLTDAQFEALRAGIGCGKSGLVVSPTSTGKTQIALWAIASGIEDGCNTVYLVTHRALAKQKFDDFKTLLLRTFLGGNGSALVMATGDYVEDADGATPPEPLRASLLVATYEKYLALLAASGIPGDMTSTVLVCDEMQLIGDEHRGQNVEVLLTLIRNAGWRQFVGLSAVLDPKDAKDLADWLNVTLVDQHTREKHLRYECWTPKGIAAVTSYSPDDIQEGLPAPVGVVLDPLSILTFLLNQKSRPVPIIVFCMRKQDTYNLAERFLAGRGKGVQRQLSLAFEALPETSANRFLTRAVAQRVAIHNADLTDEEREIVEEHLLWGKLDVVFATSTLAAGVNFPLGAAIFASWYRWDFDRRGNVPIESAEFHNMAGRVGRMGFEHKQGQVIFVATSEAEIRIARRYLTLGAMPSLEPRVAPERFNQLVLQLTASGLCNSRNGAEQLACTTFSALREQDRNNAAFARWPALLANAITELLDEGLLIETSTGKLSATPVGRAVGHSGLLPETGVFLMNYASNKAEKLAQYLPTPGNTGEAPRLAFLLFCACFSAPEFRPCDGKSPTRFLPWPLDRDTLFDADQYRDDLPEPVWQADLFPINAAKLSVDWIEGADIAALEASLPQLSAGMLRDMFRNLAWVLQGFASTVAAAVDPRTPAGWRPKALRRPDARLDLLARLPRVARRLSFRVAEGLPDDVLWMTGIVAPDSEYRISRDEILALRNLGYKTPQQVMLGSPQANQARITALAKAKPAPEVKANWLRDTCRNWKIIQRKRAAERHLKRARRCPHVGLVEDFYGTKGMAFERVLEAILSVLKIAYERLDDKTKTGAPDYLIRLEDSPPLILELKSKEGDKLVDYNKAVEVLAASEIHGYAATFCVTLCHPGVDPSVPMAIAACGRLSVVESSDLGEALLRVCEGSLTQKQLWHWLASPGQALAADLPFRDYV